jgi:benzoylformate decarboxylase/acetolactate synthase-1/2/3 large subunit
MNFPTRHPLNQSLRAGAAIGDADLVVGLEVADFWASVNALRDQLNRSTHSITKTGAKMITITTGDLYVRANYQDFRRLQDVDLAIAAASSRSARRNSRMQAASPPTARA